jgi:hypothetical protein
MRQSKYRKHLTNNQVGRLWKLSYPAGFVRRWNVLGTHEWRWLRLSFVAFCLAFGPAALPATAQQQAAIPPEVLAYPDWIVHNGKIVTMDDRSRSTNVGTIVQAMAVRDGKILKLGEDQDILRLAGPNTQRIDLKGRTVLPGLVDTHSHLHDGSSHWGMAGIPRAIVVEGSTPEELNRNLETALTGC